MLGLMSNAFASPALFSSPEEWSFPLVSPGGAAPDLPEIPSALPEPPTLGTLPAVSKPKALTFSLVAYGGLLLSAMAITLGRTAVPTPSRTIAVALDGFDPIPAPPPPPSSGPSAGVETPAASGSQTLEPTAEEVPAVLDAPPIGSPLSTQATGQTAGLGAGQVGGVAGGQAGGTVGGQVGGVVLPSFDAAYLQNPEPDYPALSKRLGEEGRVILRVFVTPEGLADQVEIRQSSGHPRLDQAALGTVRRWRFTPARRGQERLAAWVLVPLSFQLDA